MVVYPHWRGELEPCQNGASFVPVYTRCRGELAGSGKMIDFNLGLSPLARGTRERAELPVAKIRFIPAGAGNSPTISASSRSTCGLSPLARGTL